jgi:uncharacterized protein (TIGR02569 family)
VRVGDFVFKPVGGATEEAEWAATVYEGLVPAGFRVPMPLRAADGRSVVDGWSAAEFLDGQPGPQGRWSEVIDAGRAFHTALRGLPRPDFLDRRTHPWAVADRVAWGEQHVEVAAGLAEPMAALLEVRRPVPPGSAGEAVPPGSPGPAGEAQLVHGDLTGNVLFAAGRPPTVIDFSPYWRPPAFAEAVVAADGLLWFDPPPDPLPGGPDRSDRSDLPQSDRRQMLVRALIFRLVADSENAGPAGRVGTELARRYARATEAVVKAVA